MSILSVEMMPSSAYTLMARTDGFAIGIRKAMNTMIVNSMTKKHKGNRRC
jgi:hypothetical protein